MAVTYGFYDSLSGDRKYSTRQLSSIFDGIVRDGVYNAIGNKFAISVVSGTTIKVGSGRAWFNHTWTLNDADLPILLDTSSFLLNRYDEIVLEVNEDTATRANSIKVIKGTEASNASRPVLTNNTTVHQYSLGYVYRPAGSSTVTQANITQTVGSDSTPFVTGVLQSVSVETLVAQWSAAWTDWFNAYKSSSNDSVNNQLVVNQGAFDNWFRNIRALVDSNVAANLAAQILAINAKLDSLERQHVIFNTVQDSNGNNVLDSASAAITGTVNFLQV